MGWFERITEHLTGMFKSVGIRKKPEGHVAFDRKLDSGKVIHVAQKGIVHPKVKKPRVKKLAYVEPTEAPAKRKIELLAGNAHEVGTKRNIGGDVTKQKKLLSIAKKVQKNVKGGKLLSVGSEVKYKAEGSKYFITGTIKKVDKKFYHIEGKKLETGKIPTHKIMHDAVIPMKDYKGYRKPDLAAKGKESVSSGKGATARLTSGTLVERKQLAESRLGIPEEEIIKHPAFLGAAFKIVSDIAKKNGVSTELDKNQHGAFWNQAKDADYQDLLFAYGMGAMQSWRRLLAEKETKHNMDVIDENVRQFREVLTGNRKSSYITTSMQMEGKNAAIRHIKTLNDSRNSSVTPEDLEDPEHPGAKHFGGKIGSQPQQLKYTLAANNERLTDDVKKLVASLQPEEQDVLRMKMGFSPYGKPHSDIQIAEKLNGGNKKGPWDRDKVNDVIDSVMAKIKANQSAMDDMSFHVDAKLGRDVWKSDEELVADLKKSYPDAIVAVNKLGVCVMLTDELKKSFSSDLAASHPGGRWMTVKKGSLVGRHMYVLPSCDDALVKSAMDELTDFLSGGHGEA